MSEENITPAVVGEVYLHVGNSGVTFQVVNGKHGPQINLKWSAFGNLQSKLEILTTEDGLAELAHLFTIATKRKYHKHYCHEAGLVDDYEEAVDDQCLPILRELPREHKADSGRYLNSQVLQELAIKSNKDINV